MSSSREFSEPTVLDQAQVQPADEGASHQTGLRRTSHRRAGVYLKRAMETAR